MKKETTLTTFKSAMFSMTMTKSNRYPIKPNYHTMENLKNVQNISCASSKIFLVQGSKYAETARV